MLIAVQALQNDQDLSRPRAARRTTRVYLNPGSVAELRQHAPGVAPDGEEAAAISFARGAGLIVNERPSDLAERVGDLVEVVGTDGRQRWLARWHVVSIVIPADGTPASPGTGVEAIVRLADGTVFETRQPAAVLVAEVNNA